MILRRIAVACRSRDWITIIIEFALVVAGVLVALEVDNWNGERMMNEQLLQRLQLALDELEENEARISRYVSNTEPWIAGLVSLRRVIGEENLDISDQELTTLLFSLLPVSPMELRRNNIDQLMTYESLWRPEFASLRERIQDWDANYNSMQRSLSDRIDFRNDYIHRIFVDDFSLANFDNHNFARVAAFGMPPTRFAVSAEQVIGSLSIESAASGSLHLAVEAIQVAKALSRRSAELRLEIDSVDEEVRGD